jgi:hypothetical protein
MAWTHHGATATDLVLQPDRLGPQPQPACAGPLIGRDLEHGNSFDRGTPPRDPIQPIQRAEAALADRLAERAVILQAAEQQIQQRGLALVHLASHRQHGHWSLSPGKNCETIGAALPVASRIVTYEDSSVLRRQSSVASGRDLEHPESQCSRAMES